MNLLDRLKLLAKSTVNDALHDLLHEESHTSAANQPKSEPVDPAAADRQLQKLMAQADKRLATLRDDLAAAVAREKRSESAWSAINAQGRALNDQVDDLLRADKRAEAHLRLGQAKAAELRAGELERELQRFAALSSKLKQEIDELERQLALVRERSGRADERAASVDAHERAQAQAQAQRADEAQLTNQSETRTEVIAQREDKAAAKDELDTSRMADLIKKARNKP